MTSPGAPFAKLPHWRCYSEGYRVSYADRRAKGARHAFCGPHEISGARCYAGQHPLLRFLSLDTSDRRLGLATLQIPFVHLLYCWRCDMGDLEYTLERDGSVTVHGEKEWLTFLRRRRIDPSTIRRHLRDPRNHFPYQKYPEHFPARQAELTKLTATQQRALLSIERGARDPGRYGVPRHQVGGLPRLFQGSNYVPSCGGCERPMAFVAAIADDCADRRGFTGNEYVQVLYFLCIECRRMRARNETD